MCFHESVIRLVQKVTPHGKLVRAWPLTVGISAVMTALEIELADGQRRKMIVRRPGRMGGVLSPIWAG